VTRTTPLSRSKCQRSRSPGRFSHNGFNAWLGVGNYCYVASAGRCARSWGAHGGGEGRGPIVSPRAQACFGLAKVHSVWGGGMIASTFFLPAEMLKLTSKLILFVKQKQSRQRNSNKHQHFSANSFTWSMNVSY